MSLFNWAEKRIQQFKVLDFAIFKICLFLLGGIFGAYFSQFFKENIYIIAVIVIISYVWLMYKMFRR